MANIDINIKENGTTTLATAGKYCDRNIDVNVDVPNVIPEGYIKPSGSISITANGTYDVADKAEAVVDVPTYEEELAAQSALEDALMMRTVVEYSNGRITTIGDYALAGCSALRSIDVPRVASLGSYAVYSCASLLSICVPSATVVGYAAFYGCAALARVELPVCVQIGTASFYASALSTLILRSETVAKLDNTSAFANTPIKSGAGYIYVPDNLLNAYKNATNWSIYADQIKPISELEGEA